MSDNSEHKVKIRFKFRSGEEFEAEGSPDFIEKQRADFLQIIGKDGTRTSRRATATPSQPPALSAAPGTPETFLTPDSYPVTYGHTNPSTDETNVLEPSIYRHLTPSPTPASAAPNTLSAAPQINSILSAAERTGASSSGTTTPATSQEIRLWEQLVRVEDNLVILRRKSRLLSADTAALVLLAAAKVLLKASEGYSALSLSKALKKSGYGGERLDRVLGGEMKKGSVRSDGTKRSRLYYLSNEGFAHAYVLAGKLIEELH